MQNQPLDKPKLISYIALWLKRELDTWCRLGILNESQKESIRNLYAWPKEPPSRAQKSPLKLISAIETIGALLIGIGVISLIAFNWPKIPNFTKLIIIALSVVCIHLAGFFILKRKPGLQKAGFSLIFLANILYGTGIWLIAQAYHINANFATGIFLWAIGIIPFAYIIKSRLNYFFALALFILWTLNESVGSQKPHLPFLFILLGLIIPLAYYLRSRAGLVISLVTGAVWLLIDNVFWFGNNFSIILFLPLALYCLLLFAVSSLHLLSEAYRAYQKLYVYTAAALFSLVLFLLPFFGAFQPSYVPMPMENLSFYFWLCNVMLFTAIVVCWSLLSNVALNSTANTVKQMMPSLLAASLCTIVIPCLRHSVLVSLLPVLFVVFSYWYHTKSRLLVNLSLVYLFLWFPFCLISWQQAFMFFTLLLLYGCFCYTLGWFYAARLNDNLNANLFKALGLITVFFSLYLFSFDSLAGYFTDHYVFPQDAEFWYMIVLLYSALILLYERHIASFNYPSFKQGRLTEERVLGLCLPTLPVVLFFVISTGLTGFWYTFLINFSLIGLLIAFAAAGYRRSELYLKIISFIFLILVVGSRYLEMQWSLFYKSVLFIITGVAVLVLGIFLEKNKDKVVIVEK